MIVAIAAAVPAAAQLRESVFDALPADARTAIYARMWDVLSGKENAPKYARLSARDRQAVIEILRETKTDLPPGFASATR